MLDAYGQTAIDPAFALDIGGRGPSGRWEGDQTEMAVRESASGREEVRVTMRTLCETCGSKTYFIITDVDAMYVDAIRNLAYVPVAEGYGKAFPAGTPGLERTFANFERHAEEMVLQMAGVCRVPWQECLLAFLAAIRPHRIDWWLCGSAALAVRGVDIEPHDIDLVVADADAERLGEILAGHLVEPVVRVEDWFCNWFARAFLHARLEWVGGVDDRADRPEASDFGPTAASRLETVRWRGAAIRVPPLDLQLRQNQRRGLWDRVEKIERALGNRT